MRYTLQKLSNDRNVEPYLKSGWYIDGYMPSITDENKVQYLLPTYLIQAIDMSAVRFQSIPVFAAATNSYFPGTQDVGGPSLTVYDNINLDALNYFNAWLSLIKNSDGTYNLPQDFKKSFSIILYDTTGRQVKKVRFESCWPEGGFTYAFDDSSQAMTTTITFAMDSLIIENFIANPSSQ
jgi:hypothetical protein